MATSWEPLRCTSALLDYDEANEGSDTELWLVRVPADFEVGALDQCKLKFKLRGGQRHATLDAPASIEDATTAQYDVTDGASFEYAPLITMFPVAGGGDSASSSSSTGSAARFRRGRPITRMLRVALGASAASGGAGAAPISTSAATLPPLRQTRRGRGVLTCKVAMSRFTVRTALPDNGARRSTAESGGSAGRARKRKSSDGGEIGGVAAAQRKRKRTDEDDSAAGADASAAPALSEKKKKKKKEKKSKKKKKKDR